MKPRPRLQDLPFLIKRRIAGHLDFYVDKMSLRSACPKFRPIIGDPEAQCNLEVLGFSAGVLITLKIDYHLEQKRIYEKTDKGCKVRISHEKPARWVQREIDGQRAKDREILVDNEEFMEVAKKDFEMIVDNPNFSINTLSLDKRSDVNLADLLKYKLKVKEFRTRCFEAKDHAELHQILPYLDSDSLEAFELNSELESLDIEVLQQWKNLKRLEMSHNSRLSMKVWWNYPETKLELDRLKLNDLTTILEHFRSTTEAPRFELSQIHTRLDDLEIEGVFDRFGVQLHQARGYKCAQLMPDNDNERIIYLYMNNRTVQFAKEQIGWLGDVDGDCGDDEYDDYGGIYYGYDDY